LIPVFLDPSSTQFVYQQNLGVALSVVSVILN